MAVTIEGKTLALFNLGGTFYAIDNECPHSGGPLAEGLVQGESILCPWHQWTFNIKTGRGPFGGGVCVDTFAVRQESDKVLVSVAEPRPRPPVQTSGELP